jgi:hypothetical protein
MRQRSKMRQAGRSVRAPGSGRPSQLPGGRPGVGRPGVGRPGVGRPGQLPGRRPGGGLGGVLDRLPPGAAQLPYRGNNYYRHGGNYYRRYWHNGALRYVGCRPPYGIYVGELPYGYQTADYGGSTYYYDDSGTYYTSGTSSSGSIGYVVSEPPKEAVATAPKEQEVPDPFVLLKNMSDYMGRQDTFDFTATDTVNGKTDSGTSAQLSTQRLVKVQRPNRIYVEAKGDVANRKVWYDGKQLAVYSPAEKVYGITDAPDSIDDTLDFVSEKFGMSVPLADLLYSNIYESVMPGLKSGQYLGISKVGNVDCHHLAFEGKSADLQVWIQRDGTPVVRKIVIANNQAASHPRYTATVTTWNLIPKHFPDQFTFTPPKGAEKIEMLANDAGEES